MDIEPAVTMHLMNRSNLRRISTTTDPLLIRDEALPQSESIKYAESHANSTALPCYPLHISTSFLRVIP